MTHHLDESVAEPAPPFEPVEPVRIGDPGRAFDAVKPKLDQRFPDVPAYVVDADQVHDDRGGTGLALRAASVRGLSHRFYGTVRQDAYARMLSEDGRYLVACVADGVSACEYSHLAAEIVTRAGCQNLVEQLAAVPPEKLDWLLVLEKLVSRTVSAAQGIAHRNGDVPLGTDPREAGRYLASTALFAVIDLETGDDGEHTAHVVTLGDTSAWLLTPAADVAWTPLQHVKNSDSVVASSATAAIPVVPAVAPEAVIARFGPGSALVLMTDGVGDALGNGTGEVGAFLSRCWATPPTPLNFAAQVDFARRSYDDDRTALAVWPSAGS
ncbi:MULTISPECIES: protein phosphatase 2C domain-containing protein [unclassified Amycolatopsis]|uniref:protein phosphatase 2C domain-containing protein n=1 Tax=unclassified Amycolatopsis TaxID=2618356 RepID=UPI0028768720|nr:MULTISPECIES: protein phosphatase 2C domain-containing protein [unclassified Amycolatopsis]MDS0133216.1 protein phosphatase 2C domain-containing protein [Amycolatopsis sp. 505]MDS0146446.1 protein phosphatase 2C domain-containing protein [Amycolatopsis sp. CM201R]